MNCIVLIIFVKYALLLVLWHNVQSVEPDFSAGHLSPSGQIFPLAFS